MCHSEIPTVARQVLCPPTLSLALSSFSLAPLSDSRYTVFPGFCDVHVHFREPGFCYKETIRTGSMAAARGGYTAVATMPNLNPVPDSVANLTPQLEAIRKDACIAVYPYGSITTRELGESLSDMDNLAPLVLGFSDDGRGVQSDAMMESAMIQAKALKKPIVAHCEVNDLLHGGYIHAGAYAEAHHHRGIVSESEYAQVARDLDLVSKTGCKYHVCHISAKETVDLIRQAKANGLAVTCETGPHYLVLDDSNLQEDGRFKTNPPLRSASDREALLEGVLDGTVDMIATDHAPHSMEEKSRGLEKSAFGIVGLEIAFPVLYTNLVKTGILDLETLIDRMAIAPRKRFDIPLGCDFTVWDLNACDTVDPETFYSMGRATPFAGESLFGRCVLTVFQGNVVYKNQ